MVVLWGWCSSAAVHVAASCSSTDVNAAVALCVDGDAVLLPSGSANWGDNAVTITKGIQLMGSGTNFTTITYTGIGSGPELNLNAGSKVLRVGPGITFLDSANANFNGQIQCHGSQWQITGCRFNLNKGIAILSWSGPGLVNSNWFGPGTMSEIAARWGTNQWDFGPQYGTTNFVFVEGNVFSFSSFGDGAVDNYEGGRMVFRFNIVTNTLFGTHGCDSGGLRSAHTQEVYNNLFVWSLAGNFDAFIGSRGGASIYYSNRFIGNLNHAIRLDDYRYPNGGVGTSVCCAGGLSCCPPWLEASGTNPIDGNQNPPSSPSGYPTLDQVGWTGPTTFGVSSSTQVQSPVYEWSNTVTGTLVFSKVGLQESSIQLNRDVFTDTQLPGYTPSLYPYYLAISTTPTSACRVTNLRVGKTYVHQ